MQRLILLISRSDYFWSHRQAVARAARRAGFEVHVATRLTGKASEFSRIGVTVHPLPISRGGRNLRIQSQTLTELIRIYRRVRPDVVHHVSTQLVLLGSIAARYTRVPSVVNAFTGLGMLATRSNSRTSVTQRLIWNALRLIRCQNHTSIFQNADDLCDSITRNITNHNQTVLIPGSGVDIRRYTNTEFEEEDIVALPARLIWPKGIREFVEAATIVKQTIPSARMVLVGDPDPGNPQSCSKNWIRERQAQGLIEWWGHCPDMRQVYRQAQIVALPTWYGEGVPKVLLEAAACGRPLVATDTRGCRDIVRHGETGYCVPPRDPHQLADAILSLLADRRKREQMGHAGRQFVVAQFRDTDVARKTVAVYQQSLADHACPQKPEDASSKPPIPIAQEVFA